MTLCVLLTSVACTDLPDADLATPRQAAVAPIDQHPDIDLDIIDQIAAQSPEQRGTLPVKISVTDCVIHHTSRVYHLKVMHPKSEDPDHYATRRHEIRWYGSDGRTISVQPRLECVAGGIFYVKVTDRVTSAVGLARVVL